MRSTTIALGLAAALGTALLAIPAAAQNSGKPMNDGGPMPTSQSQPNQNSQMAAPGQEAGNANCATRFHSYDPTTGTYLGLDGRRHNCP